MTNGGGPGVMATDALIGAQGRLAALSPGDVEPTRRYPATQPGRAAIRWTSLAMRRPSDTCKRCRSCWKIRRSDAVLFIHAPTAIVPSAEIAAAVAPVVKQARRNVLACWLGGDAVRQARILSRQAGIPTYDTPEEAVRAFVQIVQYRRNQDLLMEVPPSRSAEFVHDREKAQAVVKGALADGRTMLSEPEAKAVLAAYSIPGRRYTDRDERRARRRRSRWTIGFPVALKILSPDVTHKSDVGGVVLDLEIAAAVDAAGQAMRRRLRAVSARRNPARLHRADHGPAAQRS